MSIKYINIVHHAHTDFGYTDHPLRARELLKKYVGQAVDLTLDSQDKQQPFAWTCETFIPVFDWWQEAFPADRDRFLTAVDAGLLGVMGLPFNVTAFLNAREWDYMINWLPDELWDRFHISSAMQNDVNGLHSGGIMKMMDRGIKNLWIGPNTYNALPPQPTPGAFFWKMPDGRRLFIWLNASYCDGYFMFNHNWRQGPVPDSNDLRYRFPREGDIFRYDDKSLKAAHELCKATIAQIEGTADTAAHLSRDGFTQNRIYGDYPWENLCVSLCNQWRVDNDPPFYPLRSFVEKWNAQGLSPQLRLVTAGKAMEYIRTEAEATLPECSGEWPDWWANGTPSIPVELAVSRKAKRILEQVHSKVFGPDGKMPEAEKTALYNLCMFDEHTYGSWAGVAYPDSSRARAGRFEKDIFPYRALTAMETLLADKIAGILNPGDEGIFVINADTSPYSGWIELPSHCLRGDYKSLENQETGEHIPLVFVDGVSNFVRPMSLDDFSDENVSETFADKQPRQQIMVWVEALPPCSVTRFIPSDMEGKITAAESGPEIWTDEQGWPMFTGFGGKPLFTGTPGSFFSVTAEGFAGRWDFRNIFFIEGLAERKKAGEKKYREIYADFQNTICSENEHEIIFTQKFTHPSLIWGKRILYIRKGEGKARLILRFNRRSNMKPEIFYASFRLIKEVTEPLISNVGQSFIPGREQIIGSCMDYFAIDGWVYYPKEKILISSQDAALVSFAKPNVTLRIDQFPADAGRVLFMIFNNTWDTNFAADSHGIMEFIFDIAFCPVSKDADKTALSLALEPVVAVNLRDKG
jgi:hypothetical protein